MDGQVDSGTVEDVASQTTIFEGVEGGIKVLRGRGQTAHHQCEAVPSEGILVRGSYMCHHIGYIAYKMWLLHHKIIVAHTNLEDMSECGLSVWYRASVGLVGQAVDDITKGGEVRVQEEGVMAWQSQVALHQSL